MKSYKKLAEEPKYEKIIMRDKIWNLLKYYTWENIVEGNIEDPITEEGLKELTDDIINIIYEK